MADKKIVINGGRKLYGEVCIEGSKNSALACIAAACLTTDGNEVVLKNIPDVSDIHVMCEIVRTLGKRVVFEHNMVVISGSFDKCEITSELAGRLRASTYFVGVLLADKGKVSCGFPGGDQIGERPIDIHIAALSKMGAFFSTAETIEAKVNGRLQGQRIYLKYPSVGATCNVILAASRAKGKTVILNAAKEPEIVDLSNLLVKMGVQIVGAGTDCITVIGSERIQGNVEHEIIPDRIETGFFSVAVAITGGEVMIKRGIPYHNYSLISVLDEAGVEVIPHEEGVRVKSSGKVKAFHVSMMPFPGLATDLQPLMTVMATQAVGTSSIVDYVFQERFQYISQLQYMGAEVEQKGNMLSISGYNKLIGNAVRGNDIRAVSALICAGLVAEGTTEVEGWYHLHRGYSNLEQKLQNLGADIIVKT